MRALGCAAVLLVVTLATLAVEGKTPKKSVDLSLATEDQQERDALAATNKFGFQLLAELVNVADGSRNVFLSPVSVSSALGMASRGATPGQPALKEMKAAFSDIKIEGEFNNKNENVLHKALDRSLTPVGDDAGVDITSANSVWLNVNAPIEDEYIRDVTAWYDATVANLTTGQAINDWVADKTKGLIKDLMDPGPVNAVAALVNAIHFKGTWGKSFDKELTQSGTFYTAAGEKEAQFMRHAEDVHEAKLAEVTVDGVETQVVELEFGKAGEYSALVVLPKLDDAEKAPLNTDKLSIIVAALGANPNLWGEWNQAVKEESGRYKVTLVLPRFKVDASEKLKEPLKSLGIKMAFNQSASAQFLDLSPDPRVYVDDVTHNAVLEVNENGAEAAAATVFQFVPFSADHSVPVTVTVNHPFMFFIQNKKTGLVMFSGKMDNPAFM